MGHWWNGDTLIYSNRLETEDRCNVHLSTTSLTFNGLVSKLSPHGEKLGLTPCATKGRTALCRAESPVAAL